MTYTTQQLIDILEQEMRATWRGERILLSSNNQIINPVVAKAIDMQKVNKVFAYQDFRRQIHEYQREHQVSGIIWRVCKFGDKSIRFPELHNQLIAVPGDKEILMSAKESVLSFWHEMTHQMNYWLVIHRRRQITPDSLEELIQQAEWAEIDAAQTELYLGLCWGNPQEYQYQWAKPNSGCHRIIAAINEPSTIKV
ncbi:conserved hypothetical protein [Gloeothece citriformis PCC 7424]|uniref:Uncharacterized protein n=1 Tax=Gloeothece citriformis (strain PCC 7424) TaxID=65393 RepID=B7KGB6_GLOC7|nr:hypothetical protein [Gloeothece citriformis]ACK70587.1 conserved hypothetical protein [Gloeothece citriformis PCC 7424]